MSVLSMTKHPLQSTVRLDRDVKKLRDPILVSGLPGIGFVGNIAAVHIIRKLSAERFGEIFSPHFQDAVYSTVNGSFRRPIIEFHVCGLPNNDRDLIILYGNTQPLTNYGQYEVSQKVLDQVYELGCRSIISLAGLKQEYVGKQPRVFCVASGFEQMEKVLPKGVNPLQGEVYGMAGLLVGLSRLKGMHGICLLSETLGIFPDPSAAKAVLEKLSSIYGFHLDISDLAETAKEVANDN